MLAALFTTLALIASASAAPQFGQWRDWQKNGNNDNNQGNSYSGDKGSQDYGYKVAGMGMSSASNDSAWNGGAIVAPPAGFTLPLPPNQSNLTMPAGQSVTIATVSRGVQNYTCTGGTWVSNGALANLYDAGLLLALTENVAPAEKVTDGLAPLFLAAQSFPSNNPAPTLRHEFVATPNKPGSISPRFFNPNTGDTVTLAKIGQIPSPDNATADVTWLELQAIEGNLAKSVFRLQTAGGQPSGGSCAEGTQASVDYAAMYYFLS